jgi:hypothetical protein
MYIVVIAWLFVTLILAASQASVVAALMSFEFWGIAPLGLILWRARRSERRRKASVQAPPPQEGNDRTPDEN